MVARDFNSAAWRRKSVDDQRRDSTFEEALQARTCQFHMSPAALWRPDVASSSHPVTRLSGIFACASLSKLTMKFLESSPPTKLATMKYGFISCMSTHGWLIARLEVGITDGPLSGKGIIPTIACEPRVAIHEGERDNSRTPPEVECSSTCSVSEFHEFGSLFRRPHAGAYGSLPVSIVFSHAHSSTHCTHVTRGPRPIGLPLLKVFFKQEESRRPDWIQLDTDPTVVHTPDKLRRRHGHGGRLDATSQHQTGPIDLVNDLHKAMDEARRVLPDLPVSVALKRAHEDSTVVEKAQDAADRARRGGGLDDSQIEDGIDGEMLGGGDED